MLRTINYTIVFLICLGYIFFAAVLNGGQDKQSIEIKAIKIMPSAGGSGRTKNYAALSFTGVAGLLPGTILEHHLKIEFMTLDGWHEYDTAERFSEVQEKGKFQGVFEINRELLPCPFWPNGWSAYDAPEGAGVPPGRDQEPNPSIQSSNSAISGSQTNMLTGRYFIVSRPAKRQRKNDIKFTEAEREQLSNRYYFALGSGSDYALFVKEEYLALKKYIDTLSSVYRSIEAVVAKSQESRNLPANDNVFKKWYNTERGKIETIYGKVTAIPDEHCQTYFPLSYDQIKKVCRLTIENFNVIDVAMLYGSSGETQTRDKMPISSVLTVDRKIDEAIEKEAKGFLTKEIIFNLSSFLNSMSDDFAASYPFDQRAPANKNDNGAPLSKKVLKNWSARLEGWQKGLDQYDAILANFVPPADKLWKDYSPKLDEEAQAVKDQLEICYSFMKEDNANPSGTNKLEPLKRKIKDIYNTICQEVRE